MKGEYILYKHHENEIKRIEIKGLKTSQSNLKLIFIVFIYIVTRKTIVSGYPVLLKAEYLDDKAPKSLLISASNGAVSSSV